MSSEWKDKTSYAQGQEDLRLYHARRRALRNQASKQFDDLIKNGAIAALERARAEATLRREAEYYQAKINLIKKHGLSIGSNCPF